MSSDGEGFMEAYSGTAWSAGYILSTEQTLNLSVTAKQPPSYERSAGSGMKNL